MATQLKENAMKLYKTFSDIEVDSDRRAAEEYYSRSLVPGMDNSDKMELQDRVVEACLPREEYAPC